MFLMTLNELRLTKNLTQKEGTILIGISLKSYRDYENNPIKKQKIKI